jgi:ABC-type polysaccharide/polyol phosphate transport system ATPase subunit
MSHITLSNVGLCFRIWQEKRIKDIIIHGSSHFSKFRNGQIDAIGDVSLDIADGERVSVIGHNGAGKSTLLKLIAGIYKPTSGSVKTDGKISCMFELASGFEVESSGWENIYLRGIMLGETPKSIREKMDEIADFSELGDYLNMPVKYYSSGMFVRLAFSISTAIKPEILLLDEVIGAGDAAFAAKASKRMAELTGQSKILILVTHGMESAITMTERCVWLEHGNIVMDGRPEDVTHAYIKAMNG